MQVSFWGPTPIGPKSLSGKRESREKARKACRRWREKEEDRRPWEAYTGWRRRRREGLTNMHGLEGSSKECWRRWVGRCPQGWGHKRHRFPHTPLSLTSSNTNPFKWFYFLRLKKRYQIRTFKLLTIEGIGFINT